MSDYTPSTEDVRIGWADLRAETVQQRVLAEAEFDRWLAEHDRDIQAQAQQDLIGDLIARDLWPVTHTLNGYPIEAVPKSALLERRNRIARLTATTEEPTDG